tara:strand:+ start:1026 stop:2705 length:1680 start_codon:yes stop_codon:yes gene_type:complete
MASQDVNIIIRAFDKTKAGFAGVTRGLKSVSGAVLNVKTALVGTVGAAGFGALVKSSINAGDELAKTADKLGVTTTALAGLRHAAELTGVSTGTMDMAMQRFTRRAAEAAQGTGEAKGALQELGINAEDLVNLPLDEQMSVVAEAMSGVERQSDKVRIAMKLFDSEGVALVNTLGGGAAALEQMTAEAEHLGLTLSRTDTAQMEAANDALTRLKAVFTGLTNQLSVAFAPIITFVADGFRQAAIDSTAFGNIGQKVASAVVKAFGFVRNIVHGLQIVFTQARLSVLQFANMIGEKLIPFLDGFIAIYNTIAKVVPGLQAIGRTGQEIIGNLPASIEETKAKIAELLQQNPGDALVAQMTEFIVANRKAAESVAELKDGIAKLPPETVSGFQKMGDSIGDFLKTLPPLKENLDTLTKSTFKGMSDGLMSIVKGTSSVADAFKQMAAQLIMQAIQLFVIDKITGGFLSFVKGLTGKAIGGSVQAGQPYMVGERGPEMFVPNQSGSIIPNDKLGGGGITVVNNVDASGASSDVDLKIRSAMQQSSQQTIASIQDLMRRRRFV